MFFQFMARRELIANKIEKFDDRPENFNTWKAAFKNMTNDVNITASEELALMLEYTTVKSHPETTGLLPGSPNLTFPQTVKYARLT